MYQHWIDDNLRQASAPYGQENEAFFEALFEEVDIDNDVLAAEWRVLGIGEDRMEDGTWEIVSAIEWERRLRVKAEGSSSDSVPSSPPLLSTRSATPALETDANQGHEDTIQVVEDMTKSEQRSEPDSASDHDAPLDLLALWW